MIVHRVQVVDSTNLHLMNMARKGAPSWTVVLADVQTGGLGRAGRTWWSPPGGLYMSVLIRPEGGIRNQSRLPILASLAVLDAMGEPLLEAVRVKWPNDILLEGKKLAGILVSSRMEGAFIPWVVTGFGLNLTRSGQMVPEELEGRLAFFEDISPGISREDLAEAILKEFQRLQICLEDDRAWTDAIKRWTARAAWDTPYLHREGQKETEGVPVRLALDGGLVLRTEKGEVTVHSGEITQASQTLESRR